MSTKKEKLAICKSYCKNPKYHNDFDFRYEAMKHMAILRNKYFDPSEEYKNRLRKLLLVRHCFYCNQPNDNRLFMSIDCNVPRKHYTIENSLPCCSCCNKLKGVLTGEE